jgi:hypothetical protein
MKPRDKTPQMAKLGETDVMEKGEGPWVVSNTPREWFEMFQRDRLTE